MKKAFLFLILISCSVYLLHAEATKKQDESSSSEAKTSEKNTAAKKSTETQTITHKVMEAETPWFLAQVYYGKGALYPRLLKTNGWNRPEEMKEGMEIRIEAPEHWDAQAGFSERYSAIWEKRSKLLGLKIDNRMPSSKVVLPTATILSHDSTPKLPFTEVKDTGKSPTEMANEELRQHPRSGTAHSE